MILSISILSRIDFDNFFVIGVIIFFCFTFTANGLGLGVRAAFRSTSLSTYEKAY
jgi:hypothetical protein